MSRRAISVLVMLALVGCATDYGRCLVENRPKSVSDAEFHSLIGAARHWIYGSVSIPPPGPIYRVRFITGAKAQIWYGDRKSDITDFAYFKRTKTGWENAGAGTDLTKR